MLKHPEKIGIIHKTLLERPRILDTFVYFLQDLNLEAIADLKDVSKVARLEEDLVLPRLLENKPKRDETVLFIKAVQNCLQNEWTLVWVWIYWMLVNRRHTNILDWTPTVLFCSQCYAEIQRLISIPASSVKCNRLHHQKRPIWLALVAHWD